MLKEAAMGDFQVRALDPAHVEGAARRLAAGDPFVREVEVTGATGFPCRVTLAWASPGERVLLFRHRPFEIASPYAEEGPVFARPDAPQAILAPGALPPYVAGMAHVGVRGYDEEATLIHAELVAGPSCAAAIARAFASGDVAFAHVRAGAHGCFQFRVDRI
jgi:hypothetical protein